MMSRNTLVLSQRISSGLIRNSRRWESSSTKIKAKDQKDMKWTERDEAPNWMQNISPPKGGTTLPDKKTSAVIGVVTVAFIYSWFIDPPKRNEDLKAVHGIMSIDTKADLITIVVVAFIFGLRLIFL